MFVKVLGDLYGNNHPYFLSFYTMPNIVQGSTIIRMR